MRTPDPSFTLDTVVIGLPSLITAIIGFLTALIFVFIISTKPNRIADNGDPQRKLIGDKIEQLGKAINGGATAFLLKEYSYLLAVALCLFVLVAAAVNWRTGIW